MQLLCGALAGPEAARIALGTAVCASFADQPLPARRTLHRVATAALLSVAASGLILACRGSPLALGGAVAGIGFLATLLLAWGPRAAFVAFAAILSVVFGLAAPVGPMSAAAGSGTWTTWLGTMSGHAGGAIAYTLWATLWSTALARHHRHAALRDLLAAMLARLGARAALVDRSEDDPGRPAAWRTWLFGEAAFVDRLQLARDFLFEGRATARQSAILLRTVELRDSLVVSRFDRALPGGAERRQWLTARSADALRRIALALEQAVRALDGRAPIADAPDLDVEALYGGTDDDGDAADDRYLRALRLRLHAMRADATRIAELARGEGVPRPLVAADARRFVSPERWPWRALAGELRRRSPAARHALRMGLAMGSAYAVAPWLPWSPHPQWLVLSVAVVLRGSFDQTLARRNARVLGTFAGCIAVLVLVPVHSSPALSLVFLGAVATSHAFISRRYWLAAAASTVMALLHSRSLDPAAGFAIAERAGDTVTGALLAWGFSYVLPTWEREKAPAAVRATLAALEAYRARVLEPAGTADAIGQRLARNRAHDALGALAGIVQRSAAEPRRVRLAETGLMDLLDHGRRLMADLSAIRILRVEPDGGPGARSAEERLRDRLQSLEADAERVLASAAHALATLEPGAPVARTPLSR